MGGSDCVAVCAFKLTCLSFIQNFFSCVYERIRVHVVLYFVRVSKKISVLLIFNNKIFSKSTFSNLQFLIIIICHVLIIFYFLNICYCVHFIKHLFLSNKFCCVSNGCSGKWMYHVFSSKSVSSTGLPFPLTNYGKYLHYLCNIVKYIRYYLCVKNKHYSKIIY